MSLRSPTPQNRKSEKRKVKKSDATQTTPQTLATGHFALALRKTPGFTARLSNSKRFASMPEDKKNGKGDASSGASPDPNSKHPFASMEYQLNTASKRWLKKYRTEFSASSASLLSTLIAYPLDSIKSRMQAYNFKTSWTCARHTYNTEGVHGFWRGTLAPLASVTLVRTVSFSIYQRAKYSIDEWMYLASGTSPLEIANTRGALPTLSTMTCFGISGAAAGAAVTAIACTLPHTDKELKVPSSGA
ncbi:MAG: hypothetical protein Q9157_005855 [Trypethelium eluteriae]